MSNNYLDWLDDTGRSNDVLEKAAKLKRFAVGARHFDALKALQFKPKAGTKPSKRLLDSIKSNGEEWLNDRLGLNRSGIAGYSRPTIDIEKVHESLGPRIKTRRKYKKPGS